MATCSEYSNSAMDNAWRESETFTFFWRKNSPFSQWHPSKFTVEEVLYVCAEQFMMHQKAKLFGDDVIADQILQEKDPPKQKSLGRKVQNFDEEKWTKHCKDIVKRGNLEKFRQNRKLRKVLFDTAGTTLAEASPVDCIWGIGYAQDHPNARDRSKWRGSNLLGEILTEVREELMSEKPDEIPGSSSRTKSQLNGGVGSNVAEESQMYTFFWKKSPFSQWYKAEFTVEGIEYNCAEQYMMHQKAVLFKDEITGGQILGTKDPKKQKGLGRKVQNFVCDVWDAECKDIVKKGNIAKFSQNPDLKKKLFDTDGTILVEASPFDRVWGIGLEASDHRAKDKSQWQGQNLLGYILTQVRDELMQKDKPSEHLSTQI